MSLIPKEEMNGNGRSVITIEGSADENVDKLVMDRLVIKNGILENDAEIARMRMDELKKESTFWKQQ